MAKTDTVTPGPVWQSSGEISPSLTQDTEPFWARVAGILGLGLVVLGGLGMIIHTAAPSSTLPSWLTRGLTALDLLPSWLATLFAVLGLGGLLLHAASETEQQIRRAYMAFGYLWLLLGILLSVYPFREQWGSLYLPYGFVCWTMGLFFLMGFLRNETDAKNYGVTVLVLGGIGVVMALGGFLFGSISENFLLKQGLLLMVLGLLFLWAFVSFYKEMPAEGVLDFLKGRTDLGRLVALAFGGVGLLFGLIALGRSLFPPLFASLGWAAPVASRYVMPSGLLLMGCGLAYFVLAVGILSEKPFVVMTRRELGAFFHSPVAYFMLLLFTVVAFFQFMLFVFQLLWDISSWAPAPEVPEPIIRPFVFSLVSVFCLVFLVPVLTMHLLSEEKRTGTLEMTLTAPQDEGTVVLSKFTAALFMFLLTWAPWGLFLVALRGYGGKTFDYLPLLAWFLVLVVSGAGFISMGLFFSSLTRNQLMAAVMSFVGMLLFVAFFLIKEYLLSRGTVWREVLGRVSFVDVWLNSLEGKLGITDLIYHLSVTVFWLFLTVKVLESRKWR